MARKVILKAPVPKSLKDRVDQLAAAREESSALIVREALEHYFAKREPVDHVAEDQAPYGAKPPTPKPGFARRADPPAAEPEEPDYPAARAAMAEIERARAIRAQQAQPGSLPQEL